MNALFLAVVIGTGSGDTLTVVHNRQPMTIRLADIEAPRNGQRFAGKSRQTLGKLCQGVKAEVRPQFKDQWGRVIAQVACRGRDASAEQVRLGMAWVDDAHSTNRTLYELQADARKAQRGLWSDPGMVAAWMGNANAGTKTTARDGAD